MPHNTIISLKNKILVALFASLILGLSACGGGGGKDKGTSGHTETTGFSEKNVKRQVFFSKEDGLALTFLSGKTGVEYSSEGSEGEGDTYPFTWSVNNKKLVTIYSSSSDTRQIDYTLKKVNGNKHTVTLNDHQESPYDHILYKAKPLSLADLDGKNISFEFDDADCPIRTIEVTGNAVKMKEECDGSREVPLTISTVSNLDNTLEFGYTLDGTPRTFMMALIEGNIAQSGIMGFINKKENVFTKVEFGKFNATDKEAEVTFELKELLKGKTLYSHDGKKTLTTFKFNSDMTSFQRLDQAGNLLLTVAITSTTDDSFFYTIDTNNKGYRITKKNTEYITMMAIEFELQTEEFRFYFDKNKAQAHLNSL